LTDPNVERELLEIEASYHDMMARLKGLYARSLTVEKQAVDQAAAESKALVVVMDETLPVATRARTVRELRDETLVKYVEYGKTLERIMGPARGITIAAAAKMLDFPGLGESNLFAWLRQIGHFYVEDGMNVPKQEYINRGYYRLAVKRVRCRDQVLRLVRQTLILPKGMDFIRRKLDEQSGAAKKNGNR
jgi:phage antirepressor YoqD-like protein